MQKYHVGKMIQGVLRGLDTRSKDVLSSRFGLDRAETFTLAKIGEKYGITRERVRQLEAVAVRAATHAFTNDKTFAGFVSVAQKALRRNGGAQRNDLFCAALATTTLAGSGHVPSAVVQNQIRFLLETLGGFGYASDDAQCHSFWYLSREHRQRTMGAVDRLAALFGSQRTVLAAAGGSEKLLKDFAKKEGMSNDAVAQHTFVSKRFAKNIFGDFGLADWPEVQPKTARDWAHLMLKKEGKALHFSDIAKRVNGVRDRRVHHQTVHNELIKDPGFVLVGKGMYGLREHGYEPGVAREVIHRVLKTHGPLASAEVVKKVLETRFYQPNTVLINLQNKKHFVRLPSGEYTVREA